MSAKIVGWIADIPAYNDHLPCRTMVFEKRELENVQAEIEWTALHDEHTVRWLIQRAELAERAGR